MNARLLVLGIAAYLLLKRVPQGIASQFVFGSPTVSFSQFIASLGNGIGVAFIVNVPVANNFDVGAPVNDFDGQILYGNAPIATLKLNGAHFIAANAETTLEVIANVNAVDTIATVIALVQSGNVVQPVTINGRALILGKWWPVKQTINLI